MTASIFKQHAPKISASQSTEAAQIGFLPHSALVCLCAVVILYIARSIGELSATPFDPRVFAHCCVLVAVAYPLQTILAANVMLTFGNRFPSSACAIVGCGLAAFPIAMLCPTISWVLGLLPVPVGAVETRAEFLAYLAQKLPTIFAAFVLLGTVLWMSLSFPWWARTLARSEASDVRHAGAVSMEAPDTTPVPQREPETSYLIRKMPSAKRGKILALSAEQHYVRVFTENGDDLVLTSFSEAVASLPEKDGMRIHRSHWVNKNAIQMVKTQGSRLFVELRDSLEFPVSRSFSGAVRESFGELIA